ncbi:MAG: EcsC family protein [Leptospiraceae bacterium]|nr:EcsC family protein [Leptospiraceae bacterium]
MKEDLLDEEIISKTLDFAYNSSIEGMGVFSSAEDLAREYLKENNNDKIKAAESLVNWQIAKAGTSGFVTGLGGILTLPVTLPANLTSVLFIQLRMIAAIAAIAGLDVKSDKVKTLAYSCLTGSSAVEILKQVGITIGTKLTHVMIRKISIETIKQINKAVGFRLLTKFGTTGAINFGKAVPIFGGVISGGFDAVTTKTIGDISIEVFLGEG